MTKTAARTPRHAAPARDRRPGGLLGTRGLLATLPIVLVSSMAMSLGAVTAAAEEKRPTEGKDSAERGKAIRHALHTGLRKAPTAAPEATDAAVIAPASLRSTYTVVAGDTISSIAARHGLSTASVLTMNGLGWKSIIYPGQVLTLTKGTAPVPAPQPRATAGTHTIVSGDTVSAIAARFGVPAAAILKANGLSWSSIIYPGQSLTIPGAPAPSTSTAPRSTQAPAAPAPSAGTHTIAAGETISSIAAKHGVSIQSLLDANGLGWSSLIFAGRTLTIPSAVTMASTGGSITPMTAEMAANARTIVSVGRQLGVSDYGLVIALATAMQESTLRNLNWGDRDSLGLFQQRPSTGWGTPAQVTDPVYASRLFFGGPSNPNPGVTRGLLDIPGWESMPLTKAAQAVQLSAFPDAYAKWEASARAWLAQL